MNDDLTIFMPLRGRHLHTLRWLWHADRTHLPFRVIIADGEVHPTIERLLSDPATFPNLRFSYHRHADRSFSDFYAKCATSLDRVETRYTMISDNDDFPLPTGIAQCIAFLDGHPDHVSSLGGIAGFSTAPRDDPWSGVLGPVSKVRYRCHDDGTYAPRDFDQPTASDRVLSELRDFLSMYYGVYRTGALKTIMHDLQELDFSDLLLHEYYGALRTMTLGKVHADPAFLSYVRQGNTSSNFSFETDWVDHLLKSRFPTDFQALAQRIARACDCGSDEATAALEADIYRDFATYLRRMLAGTVMRHRFPRLFLVKQRLLGLKSALAPPPARRVSKEERDFWRALQADGASAETFAGHRTEMAQIRQTLDDGELVEFVRRNAPDLLV